MLFSKKKKKEGISISGEAVSNYPGSWNHGGEDEMLNIKNIHKIILSLFKKEGWVKWKDI